MKVLIVTNMYPTPQKPASGTFVKEQVESLKKEGVDIDVFYFDGSKHKSAYIWALFSFWGKILRNHYDLIHAHYVFSGIIARAQLLYPVILTHHGLEVFTTWQRFPSKWITPLVDRAIVVSNEQKNALKSKNIEVIPCGIDLELFKPVPRDQARAKLKLSLTKKYVVWAGNYLRPEKRFDLVMATIALAKENDPAIELLLVSGKPHDEVPLYMNAADVLLLVSDAEGSPMAVKEAMACNLPVVSVPVGDVAEVIGETAGCYLCNQQPEDIAEKLHQALSFPGRTRGRERMVHLDEGVIAMKILNVYHQVYQDRKLGLTRHMFGNRARRNV
jgi:glycosyltransferase involved in cell wall biosynthesis